MFETQYHDIFQIYIAACRDIHIIDVQGSSNSNGSIILEIHGQSHDYTHGGIAAAGDSFSFSDSSISSANDSKFIGDSSSRSDNTAKDPDESSVVRNLTLVLRSVKPVTWLVRPTSLQGTITVLLVSQ